ncbi:MAG TPA: YgiQ family radical SAM protein, partial [Erysipelotrichaceae bacterium]|nr:YgiQ family radical SAM protein [Erysipelotrichaceae bacterium]
MEEVMFLPINQQDVVLRGWSEVDFVLVSGDAYVDHPSFGAAIISRVLEAHGYKIALLPQPDWKQDEPFIQFGKPRLGFLVTSGNIDSMVNHYSVGRKRRTKDQYSDMGEMGKRPDRATIVYSQKIRQLFPDSPIILGGIEASLRRLAHYDFWDDKVRKSILLDAGADLLVYGMAENTIVEIAEALDSGLSIEHCVYIASTVYKTKDESFVPYDGIRLPDYAVIKKDKLAYAKSFKIQMDHQDAVWGKPLIEMQENWFVVANPMAPALTREQMDWVYQLPYMRQVHPSYKHIPAFEEVQFSLISNRGCYGSCHFCALTQHQGKVITSRSTDSL